MIRLHTLDDVGPSVMLREGILSRPNPDNVLNTVNYEDGVSPLVGPFYTKLYHEVYEQPLHRNVPISALTKRIRDYLKDSPIYFRQVSTERIKALMACDFQTKAVLIRLPSLIIITEVDVPNRDYVEMIDRFCQEAESLEIGMLYFKDGKIEVIAEEEKENEPRRI